LSNGTTFFYLLRAFDGLLEEANNNQASAVPAVNVVNTPPSAVAQAVGAIEDTPLPITLTGTDADGNALTFAIATPPTHGNLSPLSVPSCGGGLCTASVTYTPNQNFNSAIAAESFTFTVNDGTDTSTPATVTINVTPVNDVPSFTKGPDQTVNEDAGAQTVVNWATALARGPVTATDEAGQLLNFIASNNNNGLFSVQPTISATGTLTYTPAANANGSATVTVQIHDNGGTANGGVDTSAAQTFTITINAVNDVPSFTKGPNVTVANNAGAQSINNWATNLSSGPANESGQVLNFIVSNNNNALFSAQPAIAANGTLTFTPSSSASGAATVTVQIHDNGGTANGGVDTSAAQQFTITTVAVVPFSLDLRSLTGQAVTFDIPGVTSPVPTAAIQNFSAAPGPYTLRGFNALAQQVLSLTFTVNGQCNLTLP
jgi:VCBS repeat-containing protein